MSRVTCRGTPHPSPERFDGKLKAGILRTGYPTSIHCKLNTNSFSMNALSISSINYIIVIACLLQACSPATGDKISAVSTSFGKVSGLSEDSVFIFKGIPYGKAERFMPPQDPDRWQGVRKCVAFGPVAKQVVPWINDSLM